MPVQLHVRTATPASANTSDFGQRLGEQLRQSPADSKAKLKELLNYVQGKGQATGIRVVNTTKNDDLAFRAKTFGFKPYRQERTAEALTQLLSNAGVDSQVAVDVVNRVLKPEGLAYSKATAGMVAQVLTDPAVKAALKPPAKAPLELKLDKNAPVAVSLDLIRGEFTSKPVGVAVKATVLAREKLLLFKHKTGADATFRDLSDTPVLIRTGTDRIKLEDDLYFDFSKTHPNDQQEPGLPDKYLIQEWKDNKTAGPCLLIPRQDLIRHPALADKVFKVLGTITLKAQVDPSGQAESAQQPSPLPAGLEDYEISVNRFPASAKPDTAALDKFIKAHSLEIGHVLGAGGFGLAKSVTLDNNSLVVKYFMRNGAPDPVTLTSLRETKTVSEGYAAYLETSRDPNWEKPKVVTPSHYIIGRPNSSNNGAVDLELVPIAELKQTLKAQAAQGGTALQCYGLVMEKAPGLEIDKQYEALAEAPGERALVAKSGLETLRTLNSRGFVHRDIKPNNLMFDGKDVNFIDTGLLFKIRKTDADRALPGSNLEPAGDAEQRKNELPTATMGTPYYIHKDLASRAGRGYIGTQADLHAFALTILNIEARPVLRAMERIIDEKEKLTKNYGTDFQKFLDRLDDLIDLAHDYKNKPLEQGAKALKKDLADPKHLANLALQCLWMADTSHPQFTAERWADRKFSDEQYAQLLAHPALKKSKPRATP